MSRLPGGSNRGMRARVASQAKCKVNGVVDMLDVELRRRESRAYIPHMNLPNEPQDQQYQAWDTDIAFTYRAKDTKLGSRHVSRPASGRSGMNDDIRVPASTSLNGISGNSAADIEDEIVPLGVVEMPNRDNGSDSFNIQYGGSIQVPNRWHHAIPVGTYLQVYVPKKEELKDLQGPQSLATRSDDLIGRATLGWKPWEPSSVDFLKLENIANSVQDWGNLPTHTKNLLRSFVRSFAAFNELRMAAEVAAADPADRVSVLQAMKKEKISIALLEAAKELDRQNLDKAPVEDVIDMLSAGRKLLAASAGGKIGAFDANLQAYIRGQAEWKLAQERLVCAKVITGARAGDDMVIALQRYSM